MFPRDSAAPERLLCYVGWWICTFIFNGESGMRAEMLEVESHRYYTIVIYPGWGKEAFYRGGWGGGVPA